MDSWQIDRVWDIIEKVGIAMLTTQFADDSLDLRCGDELAQETIFDAL